MHVSVITKLLIAQSRQSTNMKVKLRFTVTYEF